MSDLAVAATRGVVRGAAKSQTVRNTVSKAAAGEMTGQAAGAVVDAAGEAATSAADATSRDLAADLARLADPGLPLTTVARLVAGTVVRQYLYALAAELVHQLTETVQDRAA